MAKEPSSAQNGDRDRQGRRDTETARDMVGAAGDPLRHREVGGEAWGMARLGLEMVRYSDTQTPRQTPLLKPAETPREI